MAYPTVTHHHKRFPHTSIMASPYSCDPTGVVSCTAKISQLLADISNIGTIHIPKGTFLIGTNLTIPSTVRLHFEAGATFSISAGVTLTIQTKDIISSPDIAIFGGAGTIALTAASATFDSSWFSTFSTAITALGATVCVLKVNASSTVSANTTTNANTVLRFQPGYILTVATGITLTISGPMEVGTYQIFSCQGTGVVDITSAFVPWAFSEWWGAKADGTTDCSDAINAACVAHPVVRLNYGPYYCTKTLEVLANRKLLGTTTGGGVAGTFIKTAAAGTYTGGYAIRLNSAAVVTPVVGAVISDLHLGYVGATNATSGIYASGTCLIEHIRFSHANGLYLAGTADAITVRRCQFDCNGGATDYDIYSASLGDGMLFENNHHTASGGGNAGIKIYYRTAFHMRNCVANCTIYLESCFNCTLEGLHMETGYSGSPAIEMKDCQGTIRDIFIWKQTGATIPVNITYAANSSEGTVICDNICFMVLSAYNYATARADINYTYANVIIRDCARVFHDVGNVSQKTRCGIRVSQNGTAYAYWNKYSHLFSHGSFISQDGSGVATMVQAHGEVAGITTAAITSISGQSGDDYWKGSTGTYFYDVTLLLCPDRLIGAQTSGGPSAGIARTVDVSGPVYIGLNFSRPCIARLYRGLASGSYDYYVDVPMIGGENLYDFGTHVMGYPWLARAAADVDDVVAANQFILHGSFAEIYNSAVPGYGTWAVGDKWWDNDPAGGATPGGICAVAGTPGTWYNMPLLSNENYGITAAIATGATVAHGLGSTPTVVIVTPAETGPTDVTVSAVGAATFIVNFGGGGNKTFYWQAKLN